jgi:hypothetical protein
VKNKRRWPKWLVILSYSFGIFFILFIGSIILNIVLKNKLQTKLKTFSPYLQINYSAINTSPFSSSVSINDIDIHYKPDIKDQQHQHIFYFSKVELSGINFLKLLFGKKLSLNNLRIEKGNIELDQFLLNKKDSAFKNIINQIPIKNISLNHFELARTAVWLHKDKENHLLLNANATIDDIEIDDLNKPLTERNLRFSSIETNLSGINYYIADVGDTLKLKNLEINSKKQRLQINCLKLIPQYSIRQFNKTENKTSRIEASISGITVTNLDIIKLFDKKFIAGNIIFHKTDVDFLNDNRRSMKLQPESGKVFSSDKLPLEIQIDSFKIDHSSLVYEYFSKDAGVKNTINSPSVPFKNISINHLEISDAAVSRRSNNTNQLSFKANINIDRIKTDSSTNFLKDNGFHFAAINCALSEIKYSIPNAYYTIQIKKLEMDSKKQMLEINSLKVIPQYGKYELGRKLAHQADYIDATVSNIKLMNLDVMKLPEKQLIAENISINESNIYVFRDRRLPRPSLPQPLPVAYLKNLPIEIRVKTFQVNHSTVAYEEFPKGGSKTGILKVENVNATLSTLINHPLKSDPDHMNMNFEGSLMGSGAINASIYLPLHSQQYFVKGVIKNLDLVTLNSSAENLGKFHIESGILNNLSFQFYFNKEKAIGKIVGEYHNLIIDRLTGNDRKIARIPSFLLKKLIIPKNKDKTMPVDKRTGTIKYKRDATRFISFFLLKALLTGIRSSFTFGFLLPK